MVSGTEPTLSPASEENSGQTAKTDTAELKSLTASQPSLMSASCCILGMHEAMTDGSHTGPPL